MAKIIIGPEALLGSEARLDRRLFLAEIDALKAKGRPGVVDGLNPGKGYNPCKRSSIGMSHIAIDRDRIADFCRRNHIRRLSLFGSVLRDDFKPESDVDVLVEFDPGHTPGLDFFSMEEELSRIMGRKVDLNTPGFLSPYLRDRIDRESEVQYVTA